MMGGYGDQAEYRLDIAHDISVAKHHAFRYTAGTGGVNDGSQVGICHLGISFAGGLCKLLRYRLRAIKVPDMDRCCRNSFA